MSPFSRAARPFRALRPRTSGRLAVAAVLLGATAVSGAASAEGERGVLVIEGRGGTTTTFTVAETVSLQQPQPSELAGGGEYAAVLVEALEPANSAQRLGAVRVRAFRDGTDGAMTTLGIDGQLEPGTYRATLLGTGAVRVRYPLQDASAPGIRVQPRTRIGVRFLGRAEQLTAGLSRARIDLPGEAPAGRRVIQVGLTEGLAVDDYRMCVTTEADCPGNPLPVSPNVGTGVGIRAVLVPPAAAPRALRWSADGYHDTEQRLRGAAIVF